MHYPVGLRANSLETKYLSMDTDAIGNIVIGGSTMSATLLQSPDTISTSFFGNPIFQMYDISICSFTWSRYFAKNMGSQNVLVAFKSDKSSIVGAFLT